VLWRSRGADVVTGVIRNRSKTVHPWLKAIAIVTAISLAPTMVLGQAREPIRFARGANAANVSGRLEGPQHRDHLLRARAGQDVEITVASVYADLIQVRLFPAGRGLDAALPLERGGTGVSFQAKVPNDGDYVIRVALRDPRAVPLEGAGYRLRVRLTSPAPASAIFVVEFLCADRTVLRLTTNEERSMVHLERLGQTWLLPRAESASGVRFADANAAFSSRGEQALFERRSVPPLRCRQTGR